MRQEAVPSMTTGRFPRPLIVPIIALSIVVAAVVAPASSVANCILVCHRRTSGRNSSTTGSTPVTTRRKHFCPLQLFPNSSTVGNPGLSLLIISLTRFTRL